MVFLVYFFPIILMDFIIKFFFLRFGFIFVRIAERTFTTFGSRGGVVFVINGAWQLGDKLLTTDQGACWFDGRHTLRLLQPQGKLLFSEINWLAGHSPDQVQ